MIWLIGGSGRLGRELQKLIPCYAPSRNTGWDIRQDWRNVYAFRSLLDKHHPDLIIHAAGYTDVAKAEQEKRLCYETNVIGTRNLASLGIPMLYISTEYVFDGEKGNYNETDYPNPQNFYSLTKLLGEYEARATRSVVIRCLFKPRPFQHDRACRDQFTTGTHVDVMAKEISLAVSLFDKCPETLHIGFEKRSTLELARESRPDVGECSLSEIAVKLPRDTSLCSEKWRKVRDESQL